MGKDKKDIPSSSKSKTKYPVREGVEKLALLPPGLTNHTNTCFFNGTLQSLIATPMLEDALNFRHTPVFRNPSSPIPIAPSRSPALTNGRGPKCAEHEWESAMPISDSFITFMEQAWKVRDARSKSTLSPRTLLTSVGNKYAQYMDFRQQDAHELLRHLLDGMRMEEVDVIKKRQPPPPPAPKRVQPKLITSPPTAGRQEGQPDLQLRPIDEEEKLYPFVDMIFGGKLASILVCEGCKHISHTYEDFNDLSLSLKPEEKNSKRDRFFQFAHKLMKGQPASASNPSSPSLSPSIASAPPPPPISLPSAVSNVPIIAPTPVHPHVTVRPLVDDPVPPRAQSVPPPNALVGPLQALSEAAPSDIGRRRSAEYMIRSEKVHEQAATKNQGSAADSVLTLASLASTSTAVDSTSGKITLLGEPQEVEGFSARLGRRVSGRFGMKSKDRSSRSVSKEPKNKDDTLSIGQDVASEDRLSGIDDDARRSSASKRTGIFSLTPSGSREPSPQPPLPMSSAEEIKRAKKLSKAKTLVPDQSTKEKEKIKRKTQRAAREAAYLRAVLKDEPSQPHHGGGSPIVLWKIAANVASSASLQPTASSSGTQTPPNLWTKFSGTPGVIECLRQFTAVEALEGDNSLACKRCWKLSNPSLVRKKTRRKQNHAVGTAESSESDFDPSDTDTSSASESEAEDTEKSTSINIDVTSRLSLDHSAAISLNSPLTLPRPSSTSAIDILTMPTSLTPAVGSSTSLHSAPSELVSTSASPPVPNVTISAPSSFQNPHPPYGGLPIPAISTTSPDGLVPTPFPPKPLSDISQDHASSLDAQRLAATSDVESAVSSDDSDQDGDSRRSSLTTAAESVSKSPNLLSNTTSNETRPSLVRPPKSERIVRRRALKRYLISAPPPVLVIHLKRFQQVTKGPITLFGNFKKLDDYVSFPEYLDISSFIAPRKEEFGLGKHKVPSSSDQRGRSEFKQKEQKPQKHEWWKFGMDGEKQDEVQVVYRLNAVVVHIGSMLGGHYIAYTAIPSSPVPAPTTTADPNSGSVGAPPPSPQPEVTARSLSIEREDRQWCFVSDTVVRPATLEEVLKAKAYLCFYERL